MNEAQRTSLERHLRKIFPELDHMYVQIDEIDKTFYIQCDKLYENRHAVWKESDRYTLENFGWTTDWGEPYY